MTSRSLASRIAKLEGKRSQARIGDVREILKLLCDITVDEQDVFLDWLEIEWEKRLVKKKVNQAKT